MIDWANYAWLHVSTEMRNLAAPQCCQVTNSFTCYLLETTLCHVLWQVGPQRPPGAVRGPGQPQETAGRHSGAQSGAQRAVFQSELKLILELKLIFPKNEQRLMNTRMIAFDELKLIFNLKMNECNL